MTTTNDCEALTRGAGAPARSAARTDAPTPSATAAPFSKTGRKIESDQTVFCGETHLACETEFDPDFQSERIELVLHGKRLIAEHCPLPNPNGNAEAAVVDWFAFTKRTPDGDPEGIIRELRRRRMIGILKDQKGGYAGYAHKADWIQDNTRLCRIAWGGKNQAGTVYVSFSGHGCARIKDWFAVREWLEQIGATITRLDLAHDDDVGDVLSIAKAVEWYHSGGFDSGGRRPGHRLDGDWLDGEQSQMGRTLMIGSRASGKIARIYEKGKQKGDPISRWVRAEVEWHNQSRIIPYEALTERGNYLSGAYECLHYLSQEQKRIRTTRREAKISFERAMANGRRAVGKLVNLALKAYQGDYGEVVEQLRREGYPARVEPYMYAFRHAPELLLDDVDTDADQQIPTLTTTD